MDTLKHLLVTTISCLLILLCIGQPIHASTFYDLPSTHWAYAVVSKLYNAQIIHGTSANTFSPNKTLCRSECVQALYQMAPNKSTDSITNAFSDVDNSAWYAPAAQWGLDHGIITMVGGTQFSANTLVTREYMAMMVYQFLNEYYPLALQTNNSSPAFSDQGSISPTLLPYVTALHNINLFTGKNGNQFDPKGYLTRAESAVILSKLLDIANGIKNDTTDKSMIYMLERGTINLSPEEKVFVDMVNTERAKAGLSRLKVSPIVIEMSRIRAHEVVTMTTGKDLESERKVNHHVRLDGSSPKTVLGDVGLLDYVTPFSDLGFGENIYINISKLGTTRLNKISTPQEAMNSLMNSPSHRANIMNPNYSYIGVAYEKGYNSSAWMQLFIRVY